MLGFNATQYGVWLVVAALVWLAGVSAPATGVERAEGPMVFPASEPELVPQGTWIPPLLDQGQYDEFAEGVRDSAHIVVLVELPETDLPFVGYGFNFSFDGLNRSFTVFGNAESGYRLYADVNADGSLAGEAGWQLEPRGARYFVDFETTLAGQAEGRPEDYRLKSEFVFEPASADAQEPARGVWNSSTQRHGEIRIDDHSGDRIVPFELYGASGQYDYKNNQVWFDLDGDGSGAESLESAELFQVLEQFVNIDGVSYEFRVHPYGRHLVLNRLDETRPERAPLDDGSPAPAVEAVTVDGRQLDLGETDGRVVLIDFWAAWCAPCIEDAPRLAAIARRFGDRGFDIIGVAPDTADGIAEFTSRFGHDWPQIPEDFEGPVHRAYRIQGYPTKYLIGRDGHLLCGGPGERFWKDCWPRAEALLQAN